MITKNWTINKKNQENKKFLPEGASVASETAHLIEVRSGFTLKGTLADKQEGKVLPKKCFLRKWVERQEIFLLQLLELRIEKVGVVEEGEAIDISIFGSLLLPNSLTFSLFFVFWLRKWEEESKGESWGLGYYMLLKWEANI